MKIIHFFLITILSLVLNSCNKDSNTPLVLNTELENIVKKGIEFGAKGGVKDILWSTQEGSVPTIYIDYGNSSNNNWLNVNTYTKNQRCYLQIQCTKNHTDEQREATIVILYENRELTIKTKQLMPGTVTTLHDNYVFDNEKQQKEIEFKTNGKLSFLLKSDQPNWIKYTMKENQTTLSLDIEANKGLGRVCFLNVYVDGFYRHSISLRQQPASFPSTLDIPSIKAGQLYVLLGNDESNIKNIRSLEISGCLNALDLFVLKQTFISGIAAQNYPIELDLSDVHIYEGYECYYPELHIELPEQLPYIESETLPSEYFAYVANLTSIQLPAFIKAIEAGCFRGCIRLKEINIPDDVSKIGEYTFKSCTNLNNIIISPFSKLKTLGDYAFATGSLLQSLYIPAELTNISKFAFKNCNVTNLHLNWEQPPRTEVVPNGEKLFVPAGTKHLYETIPNWNTFPYIIESTAN